MESAPTEFACHFPYARRGRILYRPGVSAFAAPLVGAYCSPLHQQQHYDAGTVYAVYPTVVLSIMAGIKHQLSSKALSNNATGFEI